MSTQVISKLETKQMVARPDVNIGDTVVVDTVIRDGDKKRIQKFKGIVIAMKGKGATKTFTVRKISYGVGVEKIFPLYSPNVENIEIIKHAKVRRSKLYFLRDRIGKAATTLRAGKAVTEESNKLTEVPSEGEEENQDEVEVAVEEEVIDTNTEASKEVKEEATEESKEEEKAE